MKREEKKKAVSLGGRIILAFVLAIGLLSLTAYFVLSQSFQQLMADYSIQLIQSMVDQGVTTVEHELQANRNEAVVLAQALTVPDGTGQAIGFPKAFSESGVLRMVYVTEEGSAASDGRQTDVRGRTDIAAAMRGETAVYGPYYNEDGEYVICYSAPVWQEDKIAGVLSIEKDGYHLCELIRGIRFIDTGESYIINAEGTDIAVSDPNHIDWVKDEYNAQRLLQQGEDPVTRAIFDLEQKGLAGERGVGTYYWTGSLVYVVYAPIPSENWVLLGGMREEELAAITQSALYASISQGPVLGMCIVVFLLLSGLILFWVITSVKRHADINETLSYMANHDSLTGLLNRNSYHAALETLCREGHRSLTCIYMDANGLHEINNKLGHEAGDRMLKAVANAMKKAFPGSRLYRIGGDEFVVLCWDRAEPYVELRTEQIRQSLRGQSYEISVGIARQEKEYHAGRLVGEAEAAMQQDKRLFYQGAGNDRRMRAMDAEQERMLLEKQDADAFLSVLAPEFKGVYFVNLSSDSIRHLYIPSYFAEFLREADDRFSKALLLYAKALVKPAYYSKFTEICDYAALEEQLNKGAAPGFAYQKTNGDWIHLRILKFKNYTGRNRETLWIFENPDNAL